MNMRQTIALLAGVIVCTGLGCEKKIKSSAAIVDLTSNSTLGVGAGGKLEFVSESKDGPNFTVHFTPSLHCRNKDNDIAGSPAEAAVCEVPEGSDGTYEYMILPASPAPAPPGSQPTSGSGPPNYVSVDGCKGCTQIKTGNPAPLLAAGGGTTVYIKCDGGATSAPPATVSPGQIVEWKQIGPSATVKWSATVPSGVCSNGTAFGTVSANLPTYCQAASAAPNQSPYTYTVSIQNDTASCATPQNASLTITTANAR